jgi:hypothetical protein
MSSFLGAFLISKPAMADICSRFGGLRAEALYAMTPEVGTPPEGVRRLRIRPDLDARLGYATFSTLHDALRNMDRHHSSHLGFGVVRLLSFYWPLFTSRGATFDDSGGKDRAIGPVLGPEKCRYLVDCWDSIDLAATETLLDQYPIFFDLQHRPHASFPNAKSLLEYLGCYADFLKQAVACDSFYFSYDGG